MAVPAHVRTMVDPEVRQRDVGTPGVREDGARVRLNGRVNERREDGGRRARDDREPHGAGGPGPPLDGDCDARLADASPVASGSIAADVGLIRLDRSSQAHGVGCGARLERSLWSSVQAVRSLPTPVSRWNGRAERPFLGRARQKMPRNPIRSGTRVPWKTVPAVTEPWSRQRQHGSSRRFARK